MPERFRLDIALVNRGLVSSRSRAGALIKEGKVTVNGKPVTKAGEMVWESDLLALADESLPFVSRGGLKLQKALEVFGVNLQGKTCLDVGASTGGFTHCMLLAGAEKVYSVDVGTDQLAPELKADPRVVCKEQCNFRYATKADIPELVDFATVDVSFISLTIILPVLYGFLKEGGRAVCLIKPQFEAGKSALGKNGVVKDPKDHVRVIHQLLPFMQEQGFGIKGLTFSPIKGPKGNIEYLIDLQKNGESVAVIPEKIVKSAHEEKE